jgi:ribosomal-protein-alanine N-acetyltransferase
VALRSDRLELRRLGGGDAAFVESLYANAQVTRTLLRIQGAISIEDAREVCQARAAVCGEHRFGAALQTDGNLIALGSVRRHTGAPGVATIGYSVLPAFWGRGFATELAALLIEFAGGTLGAREVRATTLADNPGSARVLEKLGFMVLEVGGSEVDSRGDERRITRWLLHRPSRKPSGPDR